MIEGNALAVIYGLTSAASWGAGDFSGGIAARRSHVLRVVFISQIVGASLLAILALVSAERMPASRIMIAGGLAGLFGMAGLVALYRGLADGQMGLFAPLTAIVTVVIPVVGSILSEGLPSGAQLAGFLCAMTAFWLLTRQDGETSLTNRDLTLSLIAGFCFGFFFILIDQVSEAAVLWPLVAARLASLMLLAIFVLAGQAGRQPSGGRQFAIIALAGAFDAGGNAFFALATRAGRLDVAAVTSSMYPAATVLLAWFILKERLGGLQWRGVLLTLLAIALVTL